MRKFLKKTALIFSMSLLLLAGIYAGMAILSSNVNGLAPDAFHVLRKASYNSGLPAVLLGDSVCNQLWPQRENSPNFAHLGSNQAITPAGTYLLLRKYLEHNPQTQDVFYVIIPGTLGNDLNLDFTYQYFVIPFVDHESIKLLDEETVQKLYSKFGKLFVTNKYVKTLLKNTNLFMKRYRDYLRSKPEKLYTNRLSPTAVIYLAKIRDLCTERKVKLHILPMALADVEKNHDLKDFMQDVKDYGFEDIMGRFADGIKYYPADWMFDGIHFKPEILEGHRNEIRASVMKY